MSKKKCLIIGGNGFIGSNLVQALLSTEEYDISVFSRSIGAYSNVNYIVGDYQTDKDLLNALDEEIDVIIHLISVSNPGKSAANILEPYQTDLVQSIKLIERARVLGIKRIIFASSGGTVYGPHHYLPIDEMHETNPVNNYGISKLAIEKVLRMYNHNYGMKNMILRISNPYGFGQDKDKMIGAVTVFLNKIMNNEPITLYGEGKIVRDYIYIEDLIAALLKAINYDGNEQIFNIGSGIGTSLIELIQIVEKKLNKKAEIIYQDTRTIDVEVNLLSIQKAMSELGYVPQYNLVCGIDKYLELLGCKEVHS